ncbi:MAG: saccharopine dehydrogenase [Acidimicrobiales bacterium]|nr:saccharopine dehydrogenase [Acidimicrobiales bacterium]RZV47784.1 MAG: saccharopine dehydrogenase [Acidimicrobiales bacterium]
MSQHNNHDLIVFGATSFVGKIMCQYLEDRHGSHGPLSWAIAGRTQSKLDEVLRATGADVDTIVVDAKSESDMYRLATSAKVIASTVGPYALYGSELVKACAEAGTDCCDLSGEPHWIQRMIDEHGDAAAASGARIVHSCGFDSIPSDLGVWFTQREARAERGEHCSRIAMRVKALKGGPSGGTLASMINVVEDVRADPSLRKTLANPYALAPADMRKGVRQPNVQTPQSDSASGQWVAPFVMASVNTRIVLRSHALLGQPWGEDFLYDEAMLMGEGPAGAAKAAALTGGLAGFMAGVAFGPTRSLLNKFALPQPGEGPSPEEQEAGFFDLRFHGETASGTKIVTKVTGDRDPGYGSTAKMLGEAAVLLVDTRGNATPGGFWTPATALGDQLIDRLTEHAGLTFEVVG